MPLLSHLFVVYYRHREARKQKSAPHQQTSGFPEIMKEIIKKLRFLKVVPRKPGFEPAWLSH